MAEVYYTQEEQARKDAGLEVWRDVVGFEGLYTVSDDGQVWTVERMTWLPTRNLWRKQPGKLLKFKHIPTGHHQVSMRKNGQTINAYVHRLVLLAFVGPCPAGMEACHFPDRDVHNNRVDNLRWGTRSDNVQDMITHGTFRSGFVLHRERQKWLTEQRR